MNKVKIVPVYGWGWSEGDSTIDTPAPFDVDVVKSEADKGRYHALFGVVTTRESRFANCSVVLIFRGFSTYDVLVYKSIEESDIPSGWYPEKIQPLAIGFAEIKERETLENR